MTYRVACLAAILVTVGCTRSPLTDPHIVISGATRGDVPHDANGEPILGRVRPVPPGALVPLPATPPPR